jgi:lipid II isoglutaminyl synthase (glutamine-hydrolysing)
LTNIPTSLTITVMPSTLDQSIFYITHLYPKEMSIYGDKGNIIAMQHILDKLGWAWQYQTVDIGGNLPLKTDWYFMGGGQDADQLLVAKDLMRKKETLVKQVENGVAVLAICGGYQMLGQEFVTGNGEVVEGLGILPIKTRAMDKNIKSRCIGNIVINSSLLECHLVGFENHSGQTYFTSSVAQPLGSVSAGFGNNFDDKVEGCVYKNLIGTYMHGSCLPKNPELTMWLINQVADQKTKNNQISHELYFKIKSNKIDNTIAKATKESLIKRFLK